MKNDVYIDCQKCGHGSVCKHKDKCLEYLGGDFAPDFVNVGASCKYFYFKVGNIREMR